MRCSCEATRIPALYSRARSASFVPWERGRTRRPSRTSATFAVPSLGGVSPSCGGCDRDLLLLGGYRIDEGGACWKIILGFCTSDDDGVEAWLLARLPTSAVASPNGVRFRLFM